MNNNSEYIIVILFLILPFIFYYWSKSRVYQEERFTTDKGCYWKGCLRRISDSSIPVW